MSVNVKINAYENGQQEKEKIKILIFDVSNFSPTVQFLLCTIAVFFFYIIYGYIQELIFTLDGFRPFGWFLTLVQFGFYTLFGLTERYASKITTRRIPLRTYFLLALLTLGTIGFSNASLAYLNYPTQVIFKSCKLIPVLFGGIIIQQKSYGPLDFTAAVLMCIGLILFTLADSQISPNFDITGIIMISMALLCDAIIGNVQEKSIKAFKASNAEVVLYSYGIGFVYIFVFILLLGDLHQGLLYFATNPVEKYGYAFLFSVSGYLGIQVVLTLVRTCGALVAVTVTTCRKAITMIISFLFFSKPFTFQYVWSGILVLLGIYINVYSKKNKLTLADIEKKFSYYVRFMKLRLCRKRYARAQYLAEI